MSRVPRKKTRHWVFQSFSFFFIWAKLLSLWISSWRSGGDKHHGRFHSPSGWNSHFRERRRRISCDQNASDDASCGCILTPPARKWAHCLWIMRVEFARGKIARRPASQTKIARDTRRTALNYIRDIPNHTKTMAKLTALSYVKRVQRCTYVDTMQSYICKNAIQ